MMSSDTATADPRLQVEALLRPHHIEQLRSSGLSDETIVACGFYSEHKHAAICSILDNTRIKKSCGMALVFPFFDLRGEKTGYKRVKLDNPRTDKSASKDKPIKYESPVQRSNPVYFPPLPILAEAIADSSQRIIITEGEKKAAKACQEGFATIGLVGIWGWKQRDCDVLNSQLQEISWKGREAIICFDSDAADNEQISNAESRLGERLKIAGANVRAVRLPQSDDGPKVGLDDFLITHAVGDLHKLINASTEPEKPKSVGKIEARKLDPMTTANKFLKTHAMQGQKRILHFWRDEWYAFNKYVYRKLTTPELRARIVKHIDGVAFNITAGAINNTLECLRAICIIPDRRAMPSWLRKKQPFPATECLVTKNTIIHLPTMETVENDPDLLTVNAVDFEYDPTAQCPQWITFLETVWADDRECINTLQEIFGYLLLPDTSQQKIFLLVGPRRSGKGTIGRLIHELIGPDNVCNPILGSLQGEFGLQPLLGKTVAFVGDVRLSGRNDVSIIAERLLSISGEDGQSVNRKHLPMVNVKLRTRFVLATNELPRFSDASGTISSRFVILRFKKSFFGREDIRLTDKLKTELPGILNWAITGYKRLNERGRFLQPESSNDVIEEMEELASPMTAFLRECCEVVPGAQTPVDDVWVAWRRWCARVGRKEGTKQTFGRDLGAAAPGVEVKQKRALGGRLRVYEGLRLIETAEKELDVQGSHF